MSLEPRLLNEASAREYLGGRDPRVIMAPVKIGGRNCWDRVALDQKLNDIFGVRPNLPEELRESALERWRHNRRISAGDAESEELGERMEAIGGVPSSPRHKRSRDEGRA